MIPSELTSALKMLSSAFEGPGGSRDAAAGPGAETGPAPGGNGLAEAWTRRVRVPGQAGPAEVAGAGASWLVRTRYGEVTAVAAAEDAAELASAGAGDAAELASAGAADAAELASQPGAEEVTAAAEAAGGRSEGPERPGDLTRDRPDPRPAPGLSSRRAGRQRAGVKARGKRTGPVLPESGSQLASPSTRGSRIRRASSGSASAMSVRAT